MTAPNTPSRPDAHDFHPTGSPLWRGIHAILKVTLVSTGVFAASHVHAALLVYDGFGVGPGGYTEGADVVGQGHGTGWDPDSVWAGTSANPHLLTTSGSISPSSIQSQDGMVVRDTTNDPQVISRSYAYTFGGTTPSIEEAWFSFSFNRDNRQRNFAITPFTTSTTGAGQHFALVGNNDSSLLIARIRYGNSTQIVDSTETFNITLGMDYFVIGQVLFNAAGVNDELRVWVFESDSYTGGALGTPTLTAARDFNSSFDYWSFNSGNPDTASGSFTVDEFRIGTTLADVTPIPEPSGALLAGAAGLVLLLGGRRKKARRD